MGGNRKLHNIESLFLADATRAAVAKYDQTSSDPSLVTNGYIPHETCELNVGSLA